MRVMCSTKPLSSALSRADSTSPELSVNLTLIKFLFPHIARISYKHLELHSNLPPYRHPKGYHLWQYYKAPNNIPNRLPFLTRGNTLFVHFPAYFITSLYNFRPPSSNFPAVPNIPLLSTTTIPFAL